MHVGRKEVRFRIAVKLIVTTVLVLLLCAGTAWSASPAKRCAKVQTGERLVYEIRATNVSCRTARRVARLGWQVSPPGWECEYRPSSNRYYCVSDERRVRFKAIGTD